MTHNQAMPEWQGRVIERSLAAAATRSSERGRRLVDAARGLASERAAADFTVAEVAARAGVALRSFYRHFGGRDELLLALFEEEARRGAALLAEAADPLATPLERLRRYVVELCHLLVAGSGYSSLLVQEYLRIGEQWPAELRSALAPLIELLAYELDAAADAGFIRPVDHHDTVILFTTVLAHVHAQILLPPDREEQAATDRLWDFCAAALAPGSAR